MSMDAHSPWQLRDRQAQLTCDAFRATLDLTAPASGLAVSDFRGATFADLHVLGVGAAGGEVQLSLTDCYVRGRDLIATYRIAPDETTRVEIYWHVVESAALPAECMAIDLRVSVQTALLDSAQELHTISRIHAAESLDVRTPDDLERPQGCVLFRPFHVNASYGQMIHPADYVGAKLADHDGQHDLSASLFATRLEKGVILRARVRGVFAPRNTDRECVLAAYREFISEPPPLTT